MNSRGFTPVGIIIAVMFVAAIFAALFMFAWNLSNMGLSGTLITSLEANPAFTVGFILFVILVVGAMTVALLNAGGGNSQ